MANLSEKNRDITFVPTPQSPEVAGFITETAVGTAPDGWLECDGSAVSRTTYAELFAAIGTTYGVGDGSTTFNLPTETSTYDAVNMIVIIKAYDDDAGVSVGLTKIKYQYKYLTTNTSGTGVLSDLTFNSLVLGRTYRCTVNFNFGNLSTDDSNGKDISVELQHDSGVLGAGRFQLQGDDPLKFEITRIKNYSTLQRVFVATATTTTVDVTAVDRMRLDGDGTAAKTWALMEELPRHEITTDFT